MKLHVKVFVCCIPLILTYSSFSTKSALAAPPDLGYRAYWPNAIHVYDSLNHQYVPDLICDYDATDLNVAPGLFQTGYTYAFVGNAYRPYDKTSLAVTKAMTWKNHDWKQCAYQSGQKVYATGECGCDYKVVKAMILFNTASPDLPLWRTKTANSIDLAILEHEMGHAVGLGHDLDLPSGSAMQPAINLQIQRITEVDRGVINSMY